MSTDLRKRVRGLHQVKISGEGCQLLIEEPVNFLGELQLQGRGLAVGAFSSLASARCHTETAMGRHCHLGWDVVLGDPLPAIDGMASGSVLQEASPFAWHSAMADFQAPATDPSERKRLQDARIRIGNDVWIGARVTVLQGCQIGDGAVLMPGSVITEHVPPYAVMAGSPAQTVKQRFSDEVVARLLTARWWELDPMHWSGVNLTGPLASLALVEELRASGEARPYRPSWSDVTQFTG